jgi:hypothetical protein
MKSTQLLLIFGLLIFSCSKEKFPRVKYVVTSTSSADIAYTMVSGSISFETVSGSWSKSFRHSQGAAVFLSATHYGFGSTTISVYVNQELLFTESTSQPFETIQISEFIP